VGTTEAQRAQSEIRAQGQHGLAEPRALKAGSTNATNDECPCKVAWRDSVPSVPLWFNMFVSAQLSFRSPGVPEAFLHDLPFESETTVSDTFCALLRQTRAKS